MKLYKRGKTWYVDAREEGQGRVSTGCTNYDKARTVAKRIARGLGNQRHTLAEAMSRAWDWHYVGTKGARNVSSQMVRITHQFGDVPVDAVTTGWVSNTYVPYLKGTGIGNSTINRYTALLSKVMRLAAQWEWVGERPMITNLKEDGQRHRELTPEEERRIMGLLVGDDGWFADLMVFLLHTGCRLGEAFALTELDSRVARDTGRVVFRDTKNGKSRGLRLTPAARDTLTYHLWSNRTPRQAQDVWQRIRVAMGEQQNKTFVIHMLRHTCASRLLAAGTRLDVIQKYLGHGSVAVTQRYAQTHDEDVDAATVCLETVTEGGYDSPAVDWEALYHSLVEENQRLKQTVNLTAQPSVVQIHPPPPNSYEDKLETTYW